MSLVYTDVETLVDTRGEAVLSELVKMSREMVSYWNDVVVSNDKCRNYDITPDFSLVYDSGRGEVTRNISDYAFGQLCARVGVPASYVQKCFASGKQSLALDNFRQWADDCKNDLLIREYEDTVRAVLSPDYSVFDNYHVLKTLNNTVSTSRYTPRQVFVSADRLSLRFIGNEPLPIKDDKIFPGFTVNSSDVGRGSLNMKFFLFRQVCSNGLIVAEMGGTLFRQVHSGAKMTEGKISLFNQSLKNIDYLSAQAVELISANRNKLLKDYEIDMYLEKARRELKLSAKGVERLDGLVGAYGSTRWGIINALTELAQDYTLDTRIDIETWAGNMLTTNAA